MASSTSIFFVSLLVLGTRAYDDNPYANITQADSFIPSDFWSQVQQSCAPYLHALSLCPPLNSSSKLRNPAANSYTRCFTAVLKEYSPCYYNSNDEKHWWDLLSRKDDETLPEFAERSGCGYPDVLQTLKSACVYDAEDLGKCCEKSRKANECDIRSDNFIQCGMQAAQQYVRCTNAQDTAKPPSNTTACVTDNAEKVTWLPMKMLVFSGSPSCPTAQKLISTLIVSNIIAFVTAMLSNTRLWKTIFKRGKLEEYTRIRINFLSMFISIGVHVTLPFIMGFILWKQGYTVNWLSQVLLWTVRPRVAPIIAILGFINASWMEIAINEMVADLLFAIPAVNLALFAALLPKMTKNPNMPPIHKVFRAGGIIMLIPGVILGFSLVLGVLQKCAPLRAFKYPAKDLRRLVLNPFRKEKLEKQTVEMTVFRSWYINFFILGILLYIGGWMVWVSFLKMAGDLYCPAKVDMVAAVLWTYPVVLNAGRAALGSL